MLIVVRISLNWATAYIMLCFILLQKRKRGISKELEVHQRVSAVVEIVKEQHLVSI